MEIRFNAHEAKGRTDKVVKQKTKRKKIIKIVNERIENAIDEGKYIVIIDFDEDVIDEIVQIVEYLKTLDYFADISKNTNQFVPGRELITYSVTIAWCEKWSQ